MKVRDVMTTDIISVDKDVNLRHVLKLMKKNEITKLPVLEDKKLVGIVTDNNIAMKLGSIKTKGVPASRLHASSVTEKDFDTISPDDELKTVLKKVGKKGPTIINVIENENKLIGILTKADLLPLVNSTKKIHEIAKRKVVSVSPDERVIHARHLMKKEDIARIPVLDGGRLVGIISDNEIAFALASVKRSFPIGRQKHQLDELLVGKVMKKGVIWTEPNLTAEGAAKLMMKHNVGALPIMKDGNLNGIVTRTDLLRTIKPS